MIAGGGIGRDRQTVVPGCVETILTSVDDVPTIESDIPTSPVPAVGWWSSVNGFCSGPPHDLVPIAGAGQQVLVVISPLGLVIVRIGDRLGNDMWAGDYWRRLHDDVVAPLLRAGAVGHAADDAAL